MKFVAYDRVLIEVMRGICYETAVNGFTMPKKAVRFLEGIIAGTISGGIDKQTRKNVAAFILSGWAEEDGVRFEKIDDYYDEIPCSLKAYIERDDYYYDDEGAWNTVAEKIMEIFILNEKDEDEHPAITLAKEVLNF